VWTNDNALYSPHEQPLAALRTRALLIRAAGVLSLLAVLLAGAAGYLWLRGSGGSDEIVSGVPSIGGPFTL
jgi:hypothetical protein